MSDETMGEDGFTPFQIASKKLLHRAGDYAVLYVDDLTDDAKASAGLEDDDYCFVLVRLSEDFVIEVIGYDGGEPEDQLLVRDWSWVTSALDAAYRRGLSKSKKIPEEPSSTSVVGT